jgi:hypothetical protein
LGFPTGYNLYAISDLSEDNEDDALIIRTTSSEMGMRQLTVALWVRQGIDLTGDVNNMSKSLGSGQCRVG